MGSQREKTLALLDDDDIATFAELQKATDALLKGSALQEIEVPPVIQKPLSVSQSSDATRRQVIAVLGFPGVGKSTQILDLCRHFKTRPFHYPRFTRDLSLSEYERSRVEGQRQKGELITGYREQFLDAAFAVKNDRIILDGFPRSVEDTDALLNRVRQSESDLRVIYCSFTRGHEVMDSLERQLVRHQERNHGNLPEKVEVQRYIKKLERTVQHDLRALLTLQQNSTHISALNVADHSPSHVNAAIHDALETDLSSLPWLETSLAQVEECLSMAHIKSAIASCGLFYKPFFNDKYGPPSLPIDIHVGVETKKDSVALAQIFRSTFPGIRLKARCLPQLFQKMHHTPPSTQLVEVQTTGPYVWMQGGILLENGSRKLVASSQCLADLRAGVLRVDEPFLSTLDANLQEELLNLACVRAWKLLEAYPALRLEGALKNKFTGHAIPKRYLQGSSMVQALSKEAEHRHGGKLHWQKGILPEESERAQKARSILLGLSKKGEPMPIPPEVRLPGVLGDLQDRKLKYKDASDSSDSIPETHTAMIPPPEGYASWFAYMACEATDEQWREWLINQIKSKKPFCGSDPFIQKVMYLDFLDEIQEELHRNPMNSEGNQKLTHQGVPLQRHMIWSAICLETEPTCAKLQAEENINEQHICDVRSGMRVGMLVHDIGKLLDDSSIETPGVHQELGAKVWLKICPQWMHNRASAVTQWCIKYHDLPGRLARGLIEKEENTDDVGAVPSYKGAYDPSACREALATLSELPKAAHMIFCRDVWRADVGSVPSLRYLLPAADSLIAVIQSKPSLEEYISP
ncbi:MAG: hypothetical protein Q7R81_05305 [Candidatus Peregrinibacteria bacterium]|nr:hypothetical protein [Candidatus Peregrinibacteria bacterium]